MKRVSKKEREVNSSFKMVLVSIQRIALEENRQARIALAMMTLKYLMKYLGEEQLKVGYKSF